jgi:uncharacterized delta-60 repeat protein
MDPFYLLSIPSSSSASFLRKRSLLFFFAVFVAFGVRAQSGANDSTFNTSDVGYAAGDGLNGNLVGLCLQADGKILAGGAFTAYRGVAVTRIVRLNPDFSIDASFAATVGANNNVNCLVEQPDGKIIAGGAFTLYNGVSRSRINRLTASGSNDATFTPGTGANSTISAIALQPDGKILIGGAFTSYNGTAINRIARLNTNGTIDTSFHVGTGAAATVNTIALQADGKILIGGTFTSYNGSTANRIIRLNTDGSADATFTPGTAASSTVNFIKVQTDGQILISGAFATYNGTSRSRIARLNTDGTLETAFNPGTGANSTVNCIAIQADGKLIISGNFTTFNGTSRVRIARLTAMGALDATFNPGTGADASIVACVIQPDSMIVTGGNFTLYSGSPSLHINRIGITGALDLVTSVTGANNIVYSTALQPDGKILVGGTFLFYNNTSCNRLTRVNTDGSIDPGFNAGAGANNVVFSFVLQPDGKIITGGSFTSISGAARNRIARLLPTGGNDASFVPGTGANNIIYSTALQSDGSILIGGAFTSYAGTSIARIARLTSSGTLDATFNPGTGANSNVYVIKVQPDGKILVGGSFTTFNGVTQNRLVRLDASGAVDPTFTVGTGFSSGYVRDIIVQPDGKILVCGQFTSYNGTSMRHLLRLNANGTLDNTFATGTNLATSAYVQSMSLQADGKVIAVGSFTAYGGTTRNNIARLNADGTLDASVNTSLGANYLINTNVLQPDGYVVIGGQFTAYGGVGRNRLARVIMLSGINITATAAANGSITPAGTTNFVSGSNQVYTITPAMGYCVQDVLVDGVSVGPVTSYTFTSIISSHTIDVSFTAQLVPALSISSGFLNDAICPSSTVTFTATPTNGGSAPTYQWQLNGSNAATGSTYTNSSLTAGDEVICILTANNACQTTATANSNTITISITTVVNASQIVSVCPGQSFTVGVHSYSATGTYMDTLISTGGCDSIITTDLTVFGTNTASQNINVCNGQTYSIGSHTYSVTGSYVDTLVSAAGCDSILTTNLIVMGAINVGTSMLTPDTIHAVNGSASAYQWVDCNSSFAAIPGETNQDLGVVSSGDYAVIVTEGVCSDTSACVNVNLVGIHSAEDETSAVSIYPNPGNGILYINTPVDLFVIIQSVSGEQVYNANVNAGKEMLNLQYLRGGLYIFTAKDKTGAVSHHRFIIEK